MTWRKLSNSVGFYGTLAYLAVVAAITKPFENKQ